MLTRWRYRLLCWFFDRPDSLARRVRVENELMRHATRGTSPTPQECREMAQTLGVPAWVKRPNGEVRGASQLAGEASSAEGATSTVVLAGTTGGKDGK